MNYEQKELIHDYLNLEKNTKKIEKRKNQKEVEFNAQTFSGGTEFHPLGVRYKGFKVDDRVVGYIDLMNTYKRNIEKNRRRLHYFNRFLKGLDPHTTASLKRRYKQVTRYDEIQELGHDEIVLDEILEIEEAISFEFNTAITNELQRKVIQVEYTHFSEETVEDSFQAMQELLGV